MNRAATFVASIALFLCLQSFAQERESSDSGADQEEQFALDPSGVVLLPIDILSNESKYAELADTVYRALVPQIADIRGIHVIDRKLVVPFVGSELSPAEIGRQLGAATVVRSTVNALEPGYRVKIECFDAHTGKLRFSSGMQRFTNWERGTELDEDSTSSLSSAVAHIEYTIFPDRRPDREKKFNTARATLMNSSLGEKERVQALSDLRPPATSGYPQQYVDGGAALSGEVAIVAAQIASESKDSHVRGRVWHTMTGVPDPALIQPLIYSLGNDNEAWVRARAAMALAAHNEDTGVREALDSARTNDPDSKVRQAAHIAVATQEGRRELLRQLAMDVDLPEQERSTAFFYLSQINGVDPVPMDEALIEALVIFAQTARDLRIRHSTWFSLGRMAGPVVVNDLVDALATEPSETVRDWVVLALKRNIEEPGVRDALESTQLHDPSPLVRSTAERALLGEDL